MSVTWTSGVYEGAYDGTGVPPTRDSEVTAFQTMRGHTVAIVGDFNASAGTCTWTDIEHPGPVDNIAGSSFKGTNGVGFELCVCMLPGTGSGTTLAAGAAGSYDSHWTALGTYLVSSGLSAINLRIGHEMNGTWYRWSVGTANVDGGNPSGGYTDYVTYYQKIITALRAAGWTGKSVWCVNNGVSGSGSLAESAYPGDSYVDYISVDCYDQSYVSGSYPYVSGESSSARAARQLAAWNDIKTGTRGLDYWKTFATTHTKKLCFSEWGVFTRPDGHGGMDDPDFILRMYNYMVAAGSTFQYDIYFNFSASDGDHYLGPNTTAFPSSKTQYNTLWSTGGGGSGTYFFGNIALTFTGDVTAQSIAVATNTLADPTGAKLGFTGRLLVHPSLDPRWWYSPSGTPGVTTSTSPIVRQLTGNEITMSTPAVINGRPYSSPWRGIYTSTGTGTVGSGHIEAIPDPDPVIVTNHPPHQGAGAADYTWTVNDLTTPTGSGYPLSSWPAHGGGPSWYSSGDYRPIVKAHITYGTGNRYHTNTKALHFDQRFVQHMWIDLGSSIPQPFTIMIAGIINYYPSRTYGHYLLDAGKPTPAKDTSGGADYKINDGLSTRTLMLFQLHTGLICTRKRVEDGVFARVVHDYIPRPRVFYGLFNGSNSHVGHLDQRVKKSAKGRVDNNPMRYLVMGRRQDNVSDNLASHMTVFEVRIWKKALSNKEILADYAQLAATWKFNLYTKEGL